MRDSTLRRLVARLAVLDRADVAAIVDALDPEDRGTIERLLAAHAGPSRTAALSPAISACMAPDSGMTAHARAALRACADRLALPDRDARAERPSLFERIAPRLWQ